MWVRLGSTDLMAGKVMFLRSNQGDRLDGNESVADSFRSDLVGFKSWSATIFGAFYSFFVCQKNPPLPGSSPATRGEDKSNDFVKLAHSTAKRLQHVLTREQARNQYGRAELLSHLNPLLLYNYFIVQDTNRDSSE
ncbi:hypothetical protein TNCV_1457611 [Trichonephila clavipes]|nr:hypothetical protein TNCV_1457611 [Trichonephila clavipes]